jgi:hypothetical protein
VLPEPLADDVSPDQVTACKRTVVTIVIKERVPSAHTPIELALFDSTGAQLSAEVQWLDDVTAVFIAAEFTVAGTGYAAFIIDTGDNVHRINGSDITVIEGAKPTPSVTFVLPEHVYATPAAAAAGETIASDFRLRVRGYSQISTRITAVKIGAAHATLLGVYGWTLLVRASLPVVAGSLDAVMLGRTGEELARLNGAVTIVVTNNAGVAFAPHISTVAFVSQASPSRW